MAQSPPSFWFDAAAADETLPLSAHLDEVRTRARKIFESGALLRPTGGAAVLVGELPWDDEGHVLWFDAYGDGERDAHALIFDDVQVGAARLVFREAGVPVAEFTSIDFADVADPDHYRIAWQLWPQVAPLRMRLNGECFERLVPSGIPRRTMRRTDA